jgi:hypothetical protein
MTCCVATATHRADAQSSRAADSQVLGGSCRSSRWWCPNILRAGPARIAIGAAWRRSCAPPVADAPQGSFSHGGGLARSVQAPCAAHGGVRRSTRSGAG